MKWKRRFSSLCRCIPLCNCILCPIFLQTHYRLRISVYAVCLCPIPKRGASLFWVKLITITGSTRVFQYEQQRPQAPNTDRYGAHPSHVVRTFCMTNFALIRKEQIEGKKAKFVMLTTRTRLTLVCLIWFREFVLITLMYLQRI